MPFLNLLKFAKKDGCPTLAIKILIFCLSIECGREVAKIAIKKILDLA
jgi:hypothetical protein